MNTARFQCSQLWGSSTVITLDMGRQLVGEKKAIAGRVEEFRLEWPGLPVRSVCGGAPCGRKAVTSNRGCIHAHAVNCHADHLQRNCQKKNWEIITIILFFLLQCCAMYRCNTQNDHPMCQKKANKKVTLFVPPFPRTDHRPSL